MNPIFRIFSLLALVGFASAFACGQGTETAKPNTNKHISSKFDKGKDRTMVKLKAMPLTGLGDERKTVTAVASHQMDVEASFSYPGQAVTAQIAELELRFHVTAGAYLFLKPQQIVLALDQGTEQGRAIDLGFSNYKSSVQFNSVYEEFMNLTIPFTALDKMTKAKKVEIYVGPVVYQLKNEQIQDLRDFGSKMLP
ncbi:MAG: hypothetical protein ABIP75_19075 [Pyrinomonadaceae bacterium]